MGLSLGTYLGNRGRVLVGCDLRPQSEPLYKQVVEGILDSGINALLASRVATPMLLHAEVELKADSAVMVTGSHTVPGVTGLLFFKSDGGESDIDMELSLEKIYFKRLYSIQTNRATSESVDAAAIYIERILHHVGDKVKGYTIAFDAGNGSMSLMASKVLGLAGARVIAINDRPDGTFPNRSPYPRRETLGKLAETVRKRRADFGVGTDGDGDRAIFVDDSGRVLLGDVSGALLADHTLQQRFGSVVAPLNSSNLIRFVCRKRNAPLVVTKVGPPAIVSSIRKVRNAVFGLEETGKYIWPETLLYGDSVYSASRMCELLSSGSGSLKLLVSELPKYYMEKKMVRCGDVKKQSVMQIVIRKSRLEFPNARISTEDGVKVVFEDESWVLLRPSGTESYFRCYAESSSRKRAKELSAAGMKILRTSLKEFSMTRR
jgi:phosphomannomutase